MTNNQKGNSTLIFLMSMCFCALIGLKLISTKLKYIEKTKYIAQNYLCLKEFNGETKKYIHTIEVMNKALFLSQSLKYFSTLHPSLRTFILFLEKGGKGLEYGQNIKTLSYMKNYISWKKKGCIFDPQFLKTPYQLNGLSLKRDSITKRTKLRKKRWKQNLYLIKTKKVLSSDVSFKKGKLNFQTQKKFILY